jgi:3-deoxy-7-phosphoheptulonate synthase
MKFKPAFMTMMSLWKPSSWKSYPSLQIPQYPDIIHLENTKTELKRKFPLVFAGEVRKLRNELSQVRDKKAFIFQAGSCAETFDEMNVNEVKDFFQLMIQISIILGYGLDKKIIRIGRISGQFAKPRSSMFEKDNATLTFRGDIMHSIQDRSLDPERMIIAYQKSLEKLNSLRSFSKSGDLDLNDIEHWMTPWENQKYNNLIEDIKKSVDFAKNCGLEDKFLKEPDFFISHEALLLHYEECLTKKEGKSQKYYNCGAHTVWLGERTRDSPAHLEYLSGIENPIGIKIGPTTNVRELIKVCQKLNPNRETDKIMMISRMGVHQINTYLPSIIKELRNKDIPFLLLCDPCHGNTQSINTFKTRYLKDIIMEINQYFNICSQMDVYPAGIHMEISSQPVTECIGQNVTLSTLSKNYKSVVDPRLNNLQSLETALYVSNVNNYIN